MSKKSLQEILPWTSAELEKLLRELVAHGTETAKVDFKAELDLSSPEQKAELLKDITAIANTYDENYGDHGFLIYGVKAKVIVGVSATETNTDKLQNTIEQILKTYLSPMPQIYVIGFENDTGEKWGVVVIPPRNTKPHMFFKDISCPTNVTKSRKKGEWFVRRGSTTDPGLPEDLAIITQRQTAVLFEPINESVRSLQSRVARTEEQYHGALFKLVEGTISGANKNLGNDTGEIVGLDLQSRLKQRLRTPKDAIAEDLIAEAKALRTHLDGAGTGLPWDPQLNNPEGNREIIEKLEDRMRTMMLSVATIVLYDTKGVYTDALLRAIKILAKVTEVPSGVQYNRIGQALRYYPLGLILYTIFICSLEADRSALIKQVMQLPVKRQNSTDVADMTDIFFYWYELGALLNDATGQNLVAPIAARIRQVIRDNVGEMITELSEPEYFFRGEFLLALTRIDACMTHGETAEHRVPLYGLYLFLHEASEPIMSLLIEHPDWLDKIYNHPVSEILDMFDMNANKMAGSGHIAIGTYGLKAREAYDESIRRKAKK